MENEEPTKFRAITIEQFNPDWEKLTNKLATRGVAITDEVLQSTWERFQKYFSEQGEQRTATHWVNTFLKWVERSSAVEKHDSPFQRSLDHSEKAALSGEELAAMIDTKIRNAIEGETAELRSRIRALEIQLERLAGVGK